MGSLPQTEFRGHSRLRVKLECLGLLATLKLDPARSKLIGGFIESYLKLTAEETERYERDIQRLEPEEREMTSVLISSWEQKGIDQGIRQGITQGLHTGKESLILRQIRRRFGAVSASVTARLGQLSSEQLDDLGEALFDFAELADLERWLARH